MFETDVAMKLKEIHARLGLIMQQKINEYDLRIGLLHLAILVKRYPEKSQKELAEKMRFTEGAMSHSVKILIDRGILKQIPLESDMRYNRLVVTKRGDNFINDYEKYITMVYKDIFIGFDEKELKDLDNYLKRININVSKIDRQYFENINEEG